MVQPRRVVLSHGPSLQCGREITGSGFVISRDPVGTGLDYEELGAFCDQDCSDRRFRPYLYEAPEEEILS